MLFEYILILRRTDSFLANKTVFGIDRPNQIVHNSEKVVLKMRRRLKGVCNTYERCFF